jgi:hypothetical protein
MPTDRSTLARECIDHPKPVLSLRTQTSSYGILPDVIHVRCELRATLISSQSMIEISFLPKDMIDTWMETFPISNYVAHRLITRKRQHCVQVIRH